MATEKLQFEFFPSKWYIDQYYADKNHNRELTTPLLCKNINRGQLLYLLEIHKKIFAYNIMHSIRCGNHLRALYGFSTHSICFEQKGTNIILKWLRISIISGHYSSLPFGFA